MLVLAIETSTSLCSTALFDGDRLIAEAASDGVNVHASKLSGLIQKCFKQAEKEISACEAVAVSSGPGSYTGLRIGLSAAKGLCYALDIPLISVNSLRSLAHAIRLEHPNAEHICAVLGAKGKSYYAAIFDNSLTIEASSGLNEENEELFISLLQSSNCIIGGYDCHKLLEALELSMPLASFSCFARYMLPSVLEAVANENFEHLAWFQPEYYRTQAVRQRELKK